MKNRRLLVLSLLLIGLLATFVSSLSLSIAAQDAPVATNVPDEQEMRPVTIEPTIAARIAATHAAEDARWEATFLDRSIFDFRIAYLIAAEGVPAESIVSADLMRQYLGAITVHSWDDFIRLNEEQLVHMLLIHASMLEEVDKVWTAQAHRNNIYIIGINVRERQLAEIVGDRCRRFGDKELLDYAENTYLYFSYFVSLEDPTQREVVDQAYLEDCTGIDGAAREPGKFVLVGRGTNRLSLYQGTDLEMVRTMLLTYTVNHNIPKPGLIPLPAAPDASLRGN